MLDPRAPCIQHNAGHEYSKKYEKKHTYVLILLIFLNENVSGSGEMIFVNSG